MGKMVMDGFLLHRSGFAQPVHSNTSSNAQLLNFGIIHGNRDEYSERGYSDFVTLVIQTPIDPPTVIDSRTDSTNFRVSMVLTIESSIWRHNKTGSIMS